MPICSAGHDSHTTDYCDVCGVALVAKGQAGAAIERCPDCDEPRVEHGRFCERCRYDFAANASAVSAPAHTVAPHAPVCAWTAIVTADRAYYDAVIARGGPDAGAMIFPPYCPPHRVPLAGAQIRIGRHSASRGVTPEIDLAGPPEDPAVSHLHAVLLAQPDGRWVLVDPGSTNGTYLNNDPEPIGVNVPIPVRDGDRIHIGAWTTITLRLHE
jgi:FHA domain